MTDLETVREIISLAHSFFEPRFQLATDAEQRYLAAIASLGGPPYRSSDAATGYGARDQRGVSMHRDSLIQKGLIWSPRRLQLDFTVPLFAEFLRDNYPARLPRGGLSECLTTAKSFAAAGANRDRTPEPRTATRSRRADRDRQPDRNRAHHQAAPRRARTTPRRPAPATTISPTHLRPSGRAVFDPPPIR